ncbi:hypothetical protein [Longimicrobium sp.]|uniref:hypothetical protein n=1 Tax=Longimicrobium sp. TaxID=2029185 RepID=UPI002E32FDBF|nr:hypothetical protein [Longimicrobium sp.]HEX6038472.1 hypothetical protein [Longimicrobium sp.]
MFGFEILDVVIGLVFVYLLLALFATALNEYIAAVLNLRGKELARGLGHLLDDLDENGAVRQARDGISAKVTTRAGLLTEQLYNHRLIRPFATRQGWMTRWWRWLRRSRLLSWLPWPAKGHPRLPSYIPARTFALALLDVLGVDGKDASLEHLVPAPANPDPAVTAARQALTNAQTAAAAPGTNKEQADKVIAAARATLTKATLAQAITDAEKALADAQDAHAASPSNATAETLTAARQTLAKVRLAQVLGILKLESPLDLTEQLVTLGGLSTAGNKLAADLQLQLAGALAGAQTQLQELHDGVEVWFNNAMDRVSGAYKRTAQGWLFFLGILIAGCMNADTIDMWRRLESDDALRAAMVRRAEAMVADVDTAARADTSQTLTLTSSRQSASSDSTKSDTTALGRAQRNYRIARARVDSLELELGWTRDQAVAAHLIRKDSDRYPKNGNPVRWLLTKIEQGLAPKGYHADLFPFDTWPSFLKLVGLLLTAIAISLGAPFWFDLLNKVISIRAAGRSPEEKPKSPEANAKRLAERAPK